MAPETYSLAEVLAVARIHPFMPLMSRIRPMQRPSRHCNNGKQRSRQMPTYGHGHCSGRVICKEDSKLKLLYARPSLTLSSYHVIERLVDDTSPQNTFRHSVYASITGGGFGSKPLFFATDVHENRRHRAHFGRFLQATGIIKPGDWVLTTHCAGELYRSLDLMLEIMENAGAAVLGAGNLMSPAEVARFLATYHVNVLTGDSSQVVQVVHQLSALPQDERDSIRLDKIIYTSEVLTAPQRALVRATLPAVKIYSIMGSAEAGPWAVSNPDLTGHDAAIGRQDFVFDTRAMVIEILPPSFAEGGSDADPVPEGDEGIIVQTSLSRLRNPLVRYITGDVGSLHPLPERARAMVPEADRPYFALLRLHGRDRRFSFEWDGEYIEFGALTALLNDEECGVVQWQVILDKMQPSLESSVEVRLLCAPRSARLLSQEALVRRIRAFLHAYSANEHRFRLVFVDSLDGFERSSTGRKVIKFVDRYN